MKNSLKTQAEINAELKALYKKWPDVKRYLFSIGCKPADAEDIFQEALLIYSRKLTDPDFELTVAPFHYVKNTCKFLWYNLSRKEGKHIKVELNDVADYMEDDWFQKEMKLKQIETAISKIGEKCQQLLKMFYGLGLSMTHIAQKLNMRNDKVAKAQKYRCLTKVKDLVRERSETSLNH